MSLRASSRFQIPNSIPDATALLEMQSLGFRSLGLEFPWALLLWRRGSACGLYAWIWDLRRPLFIFRIRCFVCSTSTVLIWHAWICDLRRPPFRFGMLEFGFFDVHSLDFACVGFGSLIYFF